MGWLVIDKTRHSLERHSPAAAASASKQGRQQTRASGDGGTRVAVAALATR
jgi:hypothetical protein